VTEVLEVTTAAEETDVDTTSDDSILVRVGGSRYAIGLAHVAEVGKVPLLTRVPGVPSWLAGVANWRGRILPVLDLRSLLGAEVVELGSPARLVVLLTDGASVGVLTDAVEGTASVGMAVAPVPAVLPGAGPELVRGQVPRDDGPVAVLDVDAVLRLRERLPRGRRGA
jgi:purine-binding chemotaxis protein CheW